MKRGSTDLCGVLAIDKPSGMTSHDVVDRVRKITGERRVGHAGTLDPMATGLIIVGVGAATRLTIYLSNHDKRYRARFVFGVATDTDDSTGRVIDLFANTPPGEGIEVLYRHDPHDVLDMLLSMKQQLPPAYSAIKKNGVTAYKAAREGKKLELEPRPITVYAARLAGIGMQQTELDDGQGKTFAAELPYWDIEVHVSKGTYIRSLARDLGQQLGCGAHIGALRRLSIANCAIDSAVTLEELEQLAAADKPLPWFDPTSLLGFPVLNLDARQAADVSNGREIRKVVQEPFQLVSCVSEGRLLAVYSRKAEGDAFKPATVIPGGVVGVV